MAVVQDLLDYQCIDATLVAFKTGPSELGWAPVPTLLNFNIIEKRTNRNKQFIIIVFLQIYGPSVVPAMFPMDILSFVCFIILHTKTEEVILMSTTKSSTMG